MSGKEQQSGAPKAEVVSNNQPEVTCVGCDDGHFGIKQVSESPGGKLVQTFVSSRLATGAQMISLSDKEDNVYQTESGQIYTVSETLPHIDTRFSDYGVSDINRVLVHHALVQSGLGGKAVKVVTGLPVDDYFVGGKPNKEFIDRKVKNLTEKTVTNKNTDITCAKIVAHNVQPEGICAFYDLLIKDDGTLNAEIAELVKSGSVGIIDIGGKTTDCAVIVNGGKAIDPTRSGTSVIGALSLNIAVEARIKEELRIDQLTSTQIDKAVLTSKIKIFGKDHDCAAIVNDEKARLANEIIVATRRHMRDGADLERVFFVGGGSLLLKEQLASMYPHAEFVNDPQFANARGMYKIARYVLK